MDDTNLEGAKIWTADQSQAEVDRLNATISDNPFLSYAATPAEGGYAIVLTSQNAQSGATRAQGA